MNAANTQRRNRAFTLIELLVVMAIVALLVAIAAPRYFRSIERAKENTLRSSLHVMRDAIDQYLADRGRYPMSVRELAERRYLREVPVDPLTGSGADWAARQRHDRRTGRRAQRRRRPRTRREPLCGLVNAA
jgi:general secretion pathway protein G